MVYELITIYFFKISRIEIVRLGLDINLDFQTIRTVEPTLNSVQPIIKLTFWY